MATLYAQNSSVNIDSANQWNTAANGSGSYVAFADLTNADVLMANGKTAIAINVNTTVAEVRTDTTGGATTGGGFTLSNGVTLRANIFAGTTSCVVYSGASPNSATVYGTVAGGSAASCNGLSNTSTGILIVTGAVTAGSNVTAYGISNASTGTITLTGAVTATGGYGIHNGSTGPVTVTGAITAGSTNNSAYGIYNGSTGPVTVTGAITGGSGTSSYGINNASTATIIVTGNVTGGSNTTAHGIYNPSTGTLTVTGIATGGAVGSAYGISNASTGRAVVTTAKGCDFGPNEGASGAAAGIYGYAGASGATYPNTSAKNLIYGKYGAPPTTGNVLQDTSDLPNSYTRVVDYATYNTRTLVDGTANTSGQPIASNVRSGTSYNFGNTTGTLAVPPPGSVALGVPTDNTTGTAALSPTALLGGDLLTRLGTCSTVATTGAQIAALGV